MTAPKTPFASAAATSIARYRSPPMAVSSGIESFGCIDKL